MEFRHENAAVVAPRFESRDGSLTQTARTTLSAGGRTLVRDIHTKGPEGTSPGPKYMTGGRARAYRRLR